MALLDSGERVGDWVVDELLGEGGMGAVFRSHNALSSRITAALKVMKPDRMDDVRERFLREVEALDGLHHPAIVRVKGWGEDTERGLLWLAMDLVEGEELGHRLRRGPMGVDEALPVFRAVAGGLAHAHARRIYHRDIKPANVILGTSGACLVDFGIAMESGRTRLSTAGVVPGTPTYMGPEVFSGVPDPRLLDVYAMGQVLHEALTGRLAFQEQPDLGTTQRMAHLVGQKLRAGALDPGEGVPDSLRDLVRRSTEPEPERRLQTMEAFVELLEGRPVVEPARAAHTLEVATFDRPLPKPPTGRTVVPAPESDDDEEGGSRRGLWLAGLGMAATVGLIALVLVLGVGAVAAVVLLWPATPRQVEVVVAGVEHPMEVRLAGRTPSSRDGGRYRFDDVGHEPAEVSVWGGPYCPPVEWRDDASCPPCCACASTVLDADAVEVVVEPGEPPAGVAVVVHTPQVDERWPLVVELAEQPGEPDGSGIRFEEVPPGSHSLVVEAGECAEDSRDCWPKCPHGCASEVQEVRVPCDGEAVEVEASVGNPTTAPRRPAVDPELVGLRVKVLHRRGAVDLAERAARILRAKGCQVVVELGQEGGMWEPFWGNVYYFRPDLDGETDKIRRLLAGIGYLSPEHEGTSEELDVVVWLNP